MNIPFHPLADLFPLMEGREFDDLAADIRRNGLREPITLFNGAILDGRNRWRACEVAGVDLNFFAYGDPDTCAEFNFRGGFQAEYFGQMTDPAAFVVSRNLRRRHLTESQRAMVAAALANMPAGRPLKENSSIDLFSKHTPPDAPRVSQDQAADMLNVGTASVKRAQTVIEHATPELAAKVRRGDVTVSAAAAIARLPEAEQRKIIGAGDRAILSAAKEVRADREVTHREERLEKIAEISRGNEELNVRTRFPVIYVDPPWRYEVAPAGGGNRAIENQYPTMTLDEICALPVRDLATDDAILYIWATMPKLAECLKVIEAWGFEYRTGAVWVKDKIGMGYHFRSQHELLLVAKLGSLPPPAVADRVSSVVQAPRGRHSEKPDEFYALIESFYPELPKIELFARAPRDGWESWGNQSSSIKEAAE